MPASRLLRRSIAPPGRAFPAVPAWVALIATIGLTSGCALLSERTGTHVSGAEPMHNEIVGEHLEIEQFEPVMQSPEARWMWHVLVGEAAASRMEPAAASAALVQALEIRPDAEVAARATAYAVAAEDMQLAARAAEAWQQADPAAAAPREVLLRLYLREDRREDALVQARAMIEGHPGDRAEGLRVLALALAQEPETVDGSLWVIEQVVADHPEDPAGYYALGLLALRLDELGVAERAGRRAVSLAPTQSEYALLLAGALIRAGELEEAEAAIAASLAASRDPASLHVGLARLQLESGYNDAAREQLARALEADGDNIEARQMKGLLAIEDGDREAARLHFRTLFERGQRRDEAAYYLGRMDEEDGELQQALRWYGEASDGARSLDATVRIATIRAQLGEMHQAREQFSQLRRTHPRSVAMLYGLEGQMLYSLGEYKASEDVFQTALRLFPYDLDLRYGLALAVERQDRFIEAESELRSILDEDPDDPRALNALGYILTLHTKRYDEAEALIARALEFQPEDPAILDSMGWVTYKQGDLERALAYLNRAYDAFPDPEVAAHLGEVLWAMNRRDEAREVWQSALERDPDHDVLRETLDRLDPR